MNRQRLREQAREALIESMISLIFALTMIVGLLRDWSVGDQLLSLLFVALGIAASVGIWFLITVIPDMIQWVRALLRE